MSSAHELNASPITDFNAKAENLTNVINNSIKNMHTDINVVKQSSKPHKFVYEQFKAIRTFAHSITENPSLNLDEYKVHINVQIENLKTLIRTFNDVIVNH